MLWYIRYIENHIHTSVAFLGMAAIHNPRLLALVLAISGCAQSPQDVGATQFYRDALASDGSYPEQVLPDAVQDIIVPQPAPLMPVQAGPLQQTSLPPSKPLPAQVNKPAAIVPQALTTEDLNYRSFLSTQSNGVATSGPRHTTPTAKAVSGGGGAQAHPRRQTSVTVETERVSSPGHPEQSIETLQVRSAPVTPVVANDIWVLTAGESIRDQIVGWGARAGWTVEWPRKLNWLVPATATLDGAFGDVDKGPVAQVVAALAEQHRPIHVQFHPGNHMIVVSGEAGK